MARVPVRMVGLGLQDRSDGASAVIESSIEIGADAQFIIDHSQISEFDQGLIDWRGLLGSKHWLGLSSSCILEEGVLKWAWGSSLTFAELEGCKAAMIIDMPDGSERLEEAWGSVIERVRQIHVLFIEPKAMKAISELEGVGEDLLLEEVRSRSLIPIVCSFDPAQRIARVAHSLGQEIVEVGMEVGLEEWLAGFLCELPQSDSGTPGIVSAARLSRR